jgi:DNA-binding response OmpR family regulator
MSEPCIEAESTGKPLRILLVEDHELVRQALAAYLQFSGFEVTTAANGAEALRALHEGQIFEVALLDLLLPDMNGIDLARKIRQTQVGIRLLVMSGWPAEANGAELKELAIERYIEKPLRLPDLETWLRGGPAAGGS